MDDLDINLKQCLTEPEELKPLLEKPHDADRLPFKIYVYKNLIQNTTKCAKIRNDVESTLNFKKKDNDLYKFSQSKDLLTEVAANKVSPEIHQFIDAIQGDLRKHLEKLTGKQLSGKHFDITASRYKAGNHLLCHNDDIKITSKNHRRALAFVYYCTNRCWSKEDGGSLILYESDATGEPVRISNSISPRDNHLIVFETTDTSWHSVQEVYCKTESRLSINGWFYTEESNLNKNLSETNLDDSMEKRIEPCPFQFLRPIPLDERLEHFFRDYVNSEYLMEKTCILIQKRFKRDSEINLINFLNKDKFDEINKALKMTVSGSDADENLEHVGPYNKRNYHRVRVDKLPQVCRDLYDAFRSELFFMFLARITGLDLQPPSLKGCDVTTATDNNNKASTSKVSENSDDDSEESDESDEDEEEDLDLVDEESEESDDDDDDSLKEETEKVGQQLKQNSIPETQSIVDNYKEEKSAATSTAATSSSTSNAILVPDQGKATTSKQRSQENDKNNKKRRRTADPLVRHEFRHLDAGSYSLIHDHGFEMGEQSALDVILHFNHDFEVNFDDGGYISYIDCTPEEDPHDMECELLTVEPKSNCLSLAYRVDGTCRFLKYISRAHKSAYQDLSCVYYERPDDLPPNSVAHISSNGSISHSCSG